MSGARRGDVVPWREGVDGDARVVELRGELACTRGRLAPRSSDLLGGVAERSLVARVGLKRARRRDHSRPVLRETPGERRADAAAGAGHHSDGALTHPFRHRAVFALYPVRSMIVAVPMPPPVHITISAVSLSVRSNSSSAVSSRMPPVAPIG